MLKRATERTADDHTEAKKEFMGMPGFVVDFLSTYDRVPSTAAMAWIRIGDRCRSALLAIRAGNFQWTHGAPG